MYPGPSPLFLCRLVPASSSIACPWGAWIPLQGQKSGSSSGQPSPAPRKPAGQHQGTQLPLPAWTGCPTHPACTGPAPAPSLLRHQPATRPRGLGRVSAPSRVSVADRWWPPSCSSSRSKPTLLCEGPPCALGQEPAGWVSANGQGPGSKLLGDRSMGEDF